VSFVVCFGYIQSLNKEWFCCLLWLYPESERRVGFVVCCGYIQSLNEEWPKQTTKLILCSGSGYNQNKQQNSFFVQALDITKTNNKTHSLESERRVIFVVCCCYIQSLNKECVLLFVLVISRA
jgi:hypothetical protein